MSRKPLVYDVIDLSNDFDLEELDWVFWVQLLQISCGQLFQILQSQSAKADSDNSAWISSPVEAENERKKPKQMEYIISI